MLYYSKKFGSGYMKQNIESIIKTQGHENQFGIDVYEWFFNEFENNYLSKINGTQRNINIINEYDDEAKQYIYTS